MAVEGENPPTKSMKPRASSDHDGRRKAAGVSSLGRLKKSLKALPAWLLSVVFHFLLLMFLTLVTYVTAPPMEKIKSFDASPFDTKVAPEEILHMMADPSDDPVRTLAASAMAGDLAKTEKPSATPVLSEAGK